MVSVRLAPDLYQTWLPLKNSFRFLLLTRQTLKNSCSFFYNFLNSRDSSLHAKNDSKHLYFGLMYVRYICWLISHHPLVFTFSYHTELIFFYLFILKTLLYLTRCAVYRNILQISNLLNVAFHRGLNLLVKEFIRAVFKKSDAIQIFILDNSSRYSFLITQSSYSFLITHPDIHSW